MFGPKIVAAKSEESSEQESEELPKLEQIEEPCPTEKESIDALREKRGKKKSESLKMCPVCSTLLKPDQKKCPKCNTPIK